jgi:hypothetical protein
MSPVIASGPLARWLGAGSERSERAAWRSRRSSTGLLRTLRALAMTALLIGCASPEADRPRGQPGADVKNWGHPVELHAGAQPYHNTPCVTEPVECHGPPPVFGPTPPPD